MLKSAHLPCLIPPLITPDHDAVQTDKTPTPQNTPNTVPTSDGEETVHVVINQLADNLLDAKDSLTAAKISQAHHANKDCALTPPSRLVTMLVF